MTELTEVLQLALLLVSRGQTAYFSFDMGAEKNKGLEYYRYMFCAENRQILAIVDWPLIGVDRLQRCSARMTYKVVLKFVATYHSSVFEWCQHQLVANQQSPKSGDSLHKTCNGSTPDPYFSPPPYQKKNKRSGHARLPYSPVVAILPAFKLSSHVRQLYFVAYSIILMPAVVLTRILTWSAYSVYQLCRMIPSFYTRSITCKERY